MATAPLILLAPPEPAAARGPSLRELEETLQSLRDCEGLVTPEQQAEYQAEIQTALSASTAKRDRYQRYLAGIEEQIGATAGERAAKMQEVARLDARIASLEAELEKGEQYVLRTLQSIFPPDPTGRITGKLKGTIVAFSAKKNPASVDDDMDEAQVPDKYKSATVSMPAELWTEITDSLDLELRARLVEAARVRVAVSKADIKSDLTADPPVPVPGAALKPLSYKLVRK